MTSYRWGEATVLALLKDVARLGYIEEWPGSGEDLIFLLQGIDCLQKGIIWAGIRNLEAVARWHLPATRLLDKYLHEEVLLNAAAELYHNGFRRDKRLLLVLGAVLGARALTVPDYFANAPRFVTRVVGLHYGSRAAEAAALTLGMPVFLVREPENPHDPNAVAVLALWGAPLGYLHRPLAAALTARCEKGETFAARVAAVLGEACDPNERLHIEVWRGDSPEKICFVQCEPAQVSSAEERSARN